MEFRIGVIGAGTHGTRYLRHALHDVPGMTATALCRRDAVAGDRLAAELGLRYFAEAQELIENPAVDGVIIATPPDSHFALARAVLDAGKPLLLEKPLTATLAEAEDLAALPDTDAPGVMLAQTLRWNPVIQKVQALWPLLGRVHLVRMAQRLAPTTLAWQHDPAIPSGGSVLITGVHLFDTVRFLTGAEFVAVQAKVDQILNHAVEDFFLATATLSDGCNAALEVSKYTQSRACWLEAVGEDGQLWADYLTGGVILRRGKQEERFDINAMAPTLPLVLTDWLKSVRDGTTPAVGFADGLATLRVAEACYRSARTGNLITL